MKGRKKDLLLDDSSAMLELEKEIVWNMKRSRELSIPSANFRFKPGCIRHLWRR